MVDLTQSLFKFPLKQILLSYPQNIFSFHSNIPFFDLEKVDIHILELAASTPPNPNFHSFKRIGRKKI